MHLIPWIRVKMSDPGSITELPLKAKAKRRQHRMKHKKTVLWGS
jgi:hypothetical protein